MRLAWRLICATVITASSSQLLRAQDLSPRAYVITPQGYNAINLTYSFFTGSILFDGATPITGATGTYNVPIVSLYHAVSFFGRSANMTASLPYAIGTFQGRIGETQHSLYRSGLLDSTFRFSVNLMGGPAMTPREFQKWKEKTLLGVSIKVVAPTGQYDPRKLINWGSNRWAFKPEFGYTEKWGKWELDGYAGVWLYTTNPQYYSPPVPSPQSVSPIGSFEGHLIYEPKKLLWFSFDANYWFGGTTSVNGFANLATRQTSSRIGGTAAIPFSKHQTLKVSYNNGAYTRFGGDYQNVSVSWQYFWLGRY